jgi:RNA polymerase sigma-70 factor (ECF subfamily)
VATRPQDGDVTALLGSVATGDAAAFAALYDVLAGRVYGVSLRILRDPHQAEDAALETFMHVWRHAPRYDPSRARPLTWVMTIAHHRAVDHVRALRAAADRAARATARDYTPPHDPVAETAAARAEYRQIRDQLAVLTAPQRAVIECVYYQGHTQSEAAVLLDIPLGTVKSRLRAALGTLRATLSDPDKTATDDPAG